MRRAISITLLLMVGLILASPMFADGGSSVRECCRRGGKHHCEATSTGGSADTSINAISSKCPCSYGGTALRYVHDFGPAAAQLFYAHALSHPAVHAQTEACYRLSFSRVRQKRGPPVFLS